jgi:DNA polymerase-3 subunit epsilon
VRRWPLERKLVATVLVLFLIPTVLVGAVLLELYRRGALDDPSALALAVALGLAAMMGYLGVMAHGIGKSLVRTLQEIQRGTELMATVNPGHRHRIRTGDELESVADEINRMADHVGEAQRSLEGQVAQATRELSEERAKLSAILAHLDEGVVVAGLEGRITLANPAAQALFGAPAHGSILGQSLWDLVDREKVAYFLDRLRGGHDTAERFTLHPAGGAVLQAGMTPFQDSERRLAGFILALRDVSRPARDEEEHQRALAETLRELRGPLASIRSLSESLADDAGPGDTRTRRSVEAIHAEALRLSALVGSPAAAERLGAGRAPAHFERIGVDDLVTVARRRLSDQPDLAEALSVERASPPIDVRAEVTALSGALAHLLRGVASRRDAGGHAWVRPARKGQVLQLEIGATGSAALDALEPLLDRPAPLGMAKPLSVRDIVGRHAGEVWAFVAAGRLGFRLTLPLESDDPAATWGRTTPRPRFVGAGLTSGAGSADTAPVRPELYDFSVLERMDRALGPAEREWLLRDLTFVALDTETTGLRPERGDRVVSLAGVKVHAGIVKRTEIFDALVSPGRPIPATSTRYHGITDAMVAEAPPIRVVLDGFLRFAERAVLVGHEIWFDLAFLREQGLGDRAVLDTRLLSHIVHGAGVDHGLEALAERVGVTIEGRHSALGDALATAEILVRLLPLLERRGVVTLGSAIDATRAAGRAASRGVRGASP